MLHLDPDPQSRSDRVRNFVARHQIALTATCTFVVTATVMHNLRMGGQEQMIEFLTNKGLIEEYAETYPIIVK